MRRGFRREDAFDPPFTEAVLVLGKALRKIVAHERCGDRATGVIPSQQPITDERSSVTQYFGKSFHTPSTTRRLMLAAWPRSASRSSMVSKISLMPNSPITATRKLIPRSKSPEPKRHPQRAGDGVHTNSRNQQAKRHRNQRLVLVLAAETDKRQNVKRYTAKNSGGPNFSANEAMLAQGNVINTTATNDPMKEDVKAAVSASAALPC